MKRVQFALVFAGICLLRLSAPECPTDDLSCDFVVVGAGTAALAAAGKLAEVRHWNICVFERGPEEKPPMKSWSTNNYKFTSAHDPMWLTEPALGTMNSKWPTNPKRDVRNIYIPRFRGRGGTSRVYGAISRRASPEVLNLWPDGWKHDNFTKYYKRLEDHYCHYDSPEVTGISQEDCAKWHGKGGAMQLNSQVKEAFQKFPVEMQYLCEDETKPWHGYKPDYNGRTEDRISCSVFQQYKLRTGYPWVPDYQPTEEDRRNRCASTARGSSYTGYYQHKEPKPFLLTSAPVTRILFKDKVAAGVEYFDPKSRATCKVWANKEVIVGGGSFDTPHLLQVSGVGPKDLLEKIKVEMVADNAHVGQHLWDHISVPYVLRLSDSSDDYCCGDANGGKAKVTVEGETYETEKLGKINGPFSWIIHYRSNITRVPEDMSDIQLYVMGDSKLFDEVGSLCTSDSPKDKNEYYSHEHQHQEEPETLREGNQGTIRIIDQWPEYRGSLNASTSNIFDKPHLNYGWTYSMNGVQSEEFKKVSKLIRDQVRFLRGMFFGNDVRPELKKLIVDEVAPGKLINTDDDLNEWIRGMFVSALHPVGTCKMPECADEFLRVNGVSKLRVCDASAFATQIDGNPAATLYGMAEKLSDMLKFQYLKHIKVAVRLELPGSCSAQFQQVNEQHDDIPNCFDIQIKESCVSSGKNTFSQIITWSLTCENDVNEHKIADDVSKLILDSGYEGGCTSEGFPRFNRKEVQLSSAREQETPKHNQEPTVFMVWCQPLPTASPDEVWSKVGGGKNLKVGTEHRFKLNCEPEMRMTYVHFDNNERELVYTHPSSSLPIIRYISTKKAASVNGGTSAAYFRTGSMVELSDGDWFSSTSYLLETVYFSSGVRLTHDFPPNNKKPGWWTGLSDGMLYYQTKDFKSSRYIVGFDLDNTIIKTKSGETFAEDEYDWMLAHPGIKPALTHNADTGFNNVIMTNQLGISTGQQDREAWMNKVEAIVAELDVPIVVIAATEKDSNRKPDIGMWEYYKCHINQFQTIDAQSAIYVGDAAGRKDDFSDSDKMFAENVEIKFQTPEEYFGGYVKQQDEL